MIELSMTLWIIIAMVWIHFIADFALQSDVMAKNKSSSNKWLSIHIAVYTVSFFLMSHLTAIYFNVEHVVWLYIAYAIINGVLHFITDWFTSRATSYLWGKGQSHWFFVVVGFDQAIHLTTLIITYQYLIGF